MGQQIVAWWRQPKLRGIPRHAGFLVDKPPPQPAEREAGSYLRTASPDAARVSPPHAACRPVSGLKPNQSTGHPLTRRRPGADAARLRSAAAVAARTGQAAWAISIRSNGSLCPAAASFHVIRKVFQRGVEVGSHPVLGVLRGTGLTRPTRPRPPGNSKNQRARASGHVSDRQFSTTTTTNEPGTILRLRPPPLPAGAFFASALLSGAAAGAYVAAER